MADPLAPSSSTASQTYSAGASSPAWTVKPEVAEARDLVGAPEEARVVAALGAGDVEAHHPDALVEVLGLGDGLAGQDLRDVGPVLPHGDDDEAELHGAHSGSRGSSPRARRGWTAAG